MSKLHKEQHYIQNAIAHEITMLNVCFLIEWHTAGIITGTFHEVNPIPKLSLPSKLLSTIHCVDQPKATHEAIWTHMLQSLKGGVYKWMHIITDLEDHEWDEWLRSWNFPVSISSCVSVNITNHVTLCEWAAAAATTTTTTTNAIITRDATFTYLNV